MPCATQAELADVGSVNGSVLSQGQRLAAQREATDVVSMTLASVVFEDPRFEDALPMGGGVAGRTNIEGVVESGMASGMEDGAPAHAGHYPESEAGAEAASEAAVEEAEEMEMRIDEPLHEASTRHGSIASGASKASSEGGRAAAAVLWSPD